MTTFKEATYEEALKALKPMYELVDKTIVNDDVINAAIELIAEVGKMFDKSYSEILKDIRGTKSVDAGTRTYWKKEA